MATTSSEEVYVKDPAAKLDYSCDWSDWLEDIGDTIVSSVWFLDAGIVKVSESNNTMKATVFISGGTSGVIYGAVNHIVTAGGREDERTITIRVQDR